MGNEVVVDGVLEKIVSFGSALQFPHHHGDWINIAYINRVISIRISVLLWVMICLFLDLGLSIAFCAASDNFCALFLGSPGTRDHTGVETGRTRDMNVSRLTVSTARPPPLYILVGHIYFF